MAAKTLSFQANPADYQLYMMLGFLSVPALLVKTAELALADLPRLWNAFRIGCSTTNVLILAVRIHHIRSSDSYTLLLPVARLSFKRLASPQSFSRASARRFPFYVDSVQTGARLETAILCQTLPMGSIATFSEGTCTVQDALHGLCKGVSDHLLRRYIYHRLSMGSINIP